MAVKKPVILIIWVIIFFAGCDGGDKRTSLVAQIDTLKIEKSQLQRQIKEAESEKQQLNKQIKTLAGLEGQIKLENLHDLQKVKIGRYTNLYDKNDDGKKEKLIVYLQPMDSNGDIVKAAGAVDVELWDLNKKAPEAMLGKWRVEPEELKKMWFATLITINYRLVFDVGNEIGESEGPLTVKATFTDYVMGKVFTEQKVIKP